MTVKIKFHYPNDPNYEFETKLVRLDLDKERIKDLNTNNGFIITEPQSTKKDLKNPNSIYSHRFGPTLESVDSYADRYRCRCGNVKSRIYNGVLCHICKTEVKYVGDNFKYFGWIVLNDPYVIIHPNLFKSIEFLIGSRVFDNILKVIDEKDENGFDRETEKPKDEPYFGIGIFEFRDRFDEILTYYYNKNTNKKEYFDDIMSDREKVFTQSIPVYTALLRPFSVDGKQFHFEGTNKTFNMMAKLAATLNRDNIRIFRKKKAKKQLLYDLQMQFNNLYKELETLLARKKGTIRQLFGGRYNFTSRCVITPQPNLKIDEVTLPYHCLVELLQQRIINVLQKSYATTYAEAHKIWYKAQIKKDQRVYDIINYLIKDRFKGLPVLINRNPTLSYGGIIYMHCVGINDNFTMGVPLRVLKSLGADFDGDCLNILYIINEAFRARAEEIFSPRNAMQISLNDGMFNNDVNHSRDTLINLNSLVNISRENYTQAQLDNIRALQRN